MERLTTSVIGDMLTDKRPVDFKKAVFAVENAFYDGKLDGHNDNLRLWELELLRIGYHRFTAAEYAERYTAPNNSLPYCLMSIINSLNE